MEVQGRPVHAPRGLLTALAERMRGRAWPALALAAALAASALVVAAQPVRSAWWTYADADATYTAAGLNLLLGEPLRYLDHPGLPLEQLIAGAFVFGELRDGGTTQGYVDGLMLDLDRTRPVYRSLAIAFYLSGALLASLLLGRFFGHWGWGLVGGLSWLAAPGLAAMSIQYRPDVPLTVLCLVFAFLIGRAVETRSAFLFVAAGFALGLTMMVKLHAAGLLPALALAAVWRHPADGWGAPLASDLASFRRRHAVWLVPLAAALAFVAVVVNVRRLPWNLTAEQVVALTGPTLLVLAYLGLASFARRSRGVLPRLLDPFYGVVATSVLAGLALPIVVSVPDGMQAMISIEKSLLGQGVNESIPAFGASLDQFGSFPLRQAFLVFVLAAIGAVVGLRSRDAAPVVWFVGALVLGVMAQARLAAVHYFAPAFVVALFGAVWLLRRANGRAAALLGVALVAYLVPPALEHRDANPLDPSFVAVTGRTLDALATRLQPGELALTPSYWPHPDTRYFDVVQPYVAHTPAYPYRFVSDSGRAPGLAEDRGLRLRYYTGPLARNLVGRQEIVLPEIGTYVVAPLDGVPDAVELLSGPGTGR